MRKFATVVLILFGLAWVAPAHAQSIPLLQSPEIVNAGAFKLVAAPVYVLGKDGADGELGLALRGGYSFSESFDAELKAALFENTTYLGADAELLLIQNDGMNFSMAAGLHTVSTDGNDTMGFELTPLVSIPLQRSADLYAGLNAAFEKIKDAPEGIDDSFTRLHLIPGIEYQLSPRTDLAAEFGIGLNDDSWHYLSAGIEFYLR